MRQPCPQLWKGQRIEYPQPIVEHERQLQARGGVRAQRLHGVPRGLGECDAVADRDVEHGEPHRAAQAEQVEEERIADHAVELCPYASARSAPIADLGGRAILCALVGGVYGGICLLYVHIVVVFVLEPELAHEKRSIECREEVLEAAEQGRSHEQGQGERADGVELHFRPAGARQPQDES